MLETKYGLRNKSLLCSHISVDDMENNIAIALGWFLCVKSLQTCLKKHWGIDATSNMEKERNHSMYSEETGTCRLYARIYILLKGS